METVLTIFLLESTILINHLFCSRLQHFLLNGPFQHRSIQYQQFFRYHHGPRLLVHQYKDHLSRTHLLTR